MELIHPLVEAYSARYSSPEEPLLHAIAQYTAEQHAQPHMLSGHVQGLFLSMMAGIMKPHRILEIGSFTGYSALCLAKGLAPDGELHTIECRAEDVAICKQHFAQSPLGQRILLHEGNALTIIPTLQQTWDLVFIDADKVNYIHYYELVLPHVRPGGLILADNVLFHGQVLEEPIKNKSAKAIQAFNEHIQKDERVEQVLLTLRDGITCITKK